MRPQKQAWNDSYNEGKSNDLVVATLQYFEGGCGVYECVSNCSKKALLNMIPEKCGLMTLSNKFRCFIDIAER